MSKAAEDTRAYITEQFMTTRRKEFSFTDDMVFHIIYGQGTEESKKALIALLNTVTGEEMPVKDIRILNPIDYRKREDSKQVEFDIRLETDSGDLFDVEMEKQPDRYFRNRCVLYITKLCDKSLDKGELYDKMKRVTMVSFAGENFLGDTESYHTEFSIRDETGRSELSDRMRFHVIEIDKVDKSKTVSEMTALERVALYFRYANDPGSEDLISQLIDSGEEAIILAENMFRELTADEIAYEKMLARQKFLWRYGSGLSAAREQGLEEGRKEGLEQGIEQGLEQGLEQGIEQGIEQGLEAGIAQGEASKALAIAKALKTKGVDIDIIAETSGLTKEEIEQL